MENENQSLTPYEYVAEMVKAKQPDDMVSAALPKKPADGQEGV